MQTKPKPAPQPYVEPELTDRLVELVELARTHGHPMTVELLKMALLNEVEAGKRN